MNKLSIKSGDTVVVLSGKDKGRQGKVMSVDPKAGKVIVEKVNMVSRHTKASRAASSRRKPPSMPARFSAFAPSAASPPGPPISCWPAARRSASARSAALKSERGGVNRNGRGKESA